MKHNIFTPLLILTLLMSLGTGCIRDNSTLEDPSQFASIDITGIEESLTATPRSQLKLAPTVTSTYPDSDLEYFWMAYPKLDEGEKQVATDTLGTSKDLDYRVILKPGTYKLVFKVVSKSDGFTAHKESTISVSELQTMGFLILTEPTPGVTEVDLFDVNTQKLVPHLITDYFGKPLEGSPLFLDVNYDMAHLDPEDYKAETMTKVNSTVFSITTSAGKALSLRSSDFAYVFPDQKVFNSDPTPEPAIGRLFGAAYSYIVTDQGLHYSFKRSALWTATRGLFSDPITEPVSPHIFGMIDEYLAYNFCAWSYTRGILCLFSSNRAEPLNGQPAAVTKYEPLYGGTSLVGKGPGVSFLILQEKEKPDNRRIVYIDLDKVKSIEEVDKSSHLNSADLFAVSGRSAQILYYVSGGSLYAYALNGTQAERQLTLTGLPAGSKITYIDNIFWLNDKDKSHRFDHLVVGTQSGDSYKLYFYNTVGGIPDGAPVRTIEGKGTLARVAYIALEDPSVRNAAPSFPILY